MYIPTYIGILLWTFAIFGFLFLILRIITGIKWKGRGDGKFSIIISSKNREDTIEGLIRGFILKGSTDGAEEAILNILLVDAGSSDDTPLIMEKLSEEYPIVKVVKTDDLSSYLKNIWAGL